ncbi:hypothetical protein FG93_01923 [Bosea sp. LC85]|uniref:hypothetical protein n=1 Tax=Bosea sp. LC85 TaxID=1502851 RepID=UPI0004E411D6|nr:hypothetical protein [Bosea sp. LC85]KFC73179.1 hypothetical protein FG93_01923 [Bosea sp. LC85]
MPEHTYALRKTWPDKADDYLVIDEHGDRIARTHLDAGTSPQTWAFSVGFGSLPQQPTFRGRCENLEEAKAKIKELWPIYRAQWTDDEIERERAHLRDLDERTKEWIAKHRPAAARLRS